MFRGAPKPLEPIACEKPPIGAVQKIEGGRNSLENDGEIAGNPVDFVHFWPPHLPAAVEKRPNSRSFGRLC